MKVERWILTIATGLVILFSVYSCYTPEPLTESDYNEWLAGGSETIFDNGAGAFRTIFPKITDDKDRIHEIGDGAFEQTFVSAPAPINPGLGPIFNNVSCIACHVNDGRGKPPVNGEQNSALLIRISLPGVDAHGGPLPVPGFGTQLQQRSIYGAQPEASISITYTEEQFQFADGDTYSLRVPIYTLEDPYATLPSNILLSPRVAPPVFGLGLLEAIDESNILSHADPDDRDKDGISGRPNYVWDVQSQKTVLGRFGWKANQPSLLQQTASAYSEDMGITNFLFPNESSYGQPQDRDPVHAPEVSDSLLYDVAFYIRTLAVPARRQAADPEVLAGKSIFVAARCSACHIPQAETKTNVAFPELSHQAIFPYTDLLLHDMGPGLADHRPDFEATGSEWRTAPLWGIGLTQVVNGHQNFLHDGRARSLLEAIMWHGGEAEASKEYVQNLSKPDREALIRFLNSL